MAPPRRRTNQPKQISLAAIQSITLQTGKWSTYRRVPAMLQLRCVGGDRAKAQLTSVQCYNRGFDGKDIQWEVKGEMSDKYRFGKLELIFESFDDIADERVLVGSAALEYTVEEVRKRTWWDSFWTNNFGPEVYKTSSPTGESSALKRKRSARKKKSSTPEKKSSTPAEDAAWWSEFWRNMAKCAIAVLSVTAVAYTANLIMNNNPNDSSSKSESDSKKKSAAGKNSNNSSSSQSASSSDKCNSVPYSEPTKPCPTSHTTNYYGNNYYSSPSCSSKPTASEERVTFRMVTGFATTRRR